MKRLATPLPHKKNSGNPPRRSAPVGFNSPAPIEAQRKTWPNKYEQAFAEKARDLGWDITKRGWPDFICYSGDEGIAVEVKPPGQQLRREQWLCMRLLSRFGIKCFVSDGEVLIPFDPELPLSWEDDGEVA